MSNYQIKTNFKLKSTIFCNQNIILISYDFGDMNIFLTCFVRFTLYSVITTHSCADLKIFYIMLECMQRFLSQQVLLFLAGPHLFVLSLSCQGFLMQKMIC